jgi:hypothetical protein
MKLLSQRPFYLHFTLGDDSDTILYVISVFLVSCHGSKSNLGQSYVIYTSPTYDKNTMQLCIGNIENAVYYVGNNNAPANGNVAQNIISYEQNGFARNQIKITVADLAFQSLNACSLPGLHICLSVFLKENRSA